MVLRRCRATVRIADGVPTLTLRASGYGWRFGPRTGETYTDSGTTAWR
jgi:autonomous glycyl radical cofactor GrcA